MERTYTVRIWRIVALLIVCCGLLSTVSARPALAQMSVPLLGQQWSPWGSDILDRGPYTLAQAGCAITSVAMLQSYVGPYTTPRDMNNWLRGNGGFSNGDIVWGQAAKRLGFMRYSGYYNWRSVPANLNVVNSYLDGGYPVVAEVRLFSRMHFVLITGHRGSTYYINDPWYGDRTTLNQRYGNPAAAIYGMPGYWWYW